MRFALSGCSAPRLRTPLHTLRPVLRTRPSYLLVSFSERKGADGDEERGVEKEKVVSPLPSMMIALDALLKASKTTKVLCLFGPSGDGLDPAIDAFVICVTGFSHRATRLVEIRGSKPSARHVFSLGVAGFSHLPVDPPPSKIQKQAMAPRPSSHHRAAALALLCLCSVSSSANGES